jgi:hypothetical protein
MVTNLPDVYTGVAFNAEPFDPSGVPLWVDLSTRYYGTGSATRGRSQYELSQGQTGTADVTWHDQDEALNPANTSSPYSPNVVPYRPYLWRVMWPAGGTGNLLGGYGYDGSFESYAVGAAPSWLTPLANLAGVSGTVATLVGAGAWQGTKAVQLAVATGSTYLGGATWTALTIPGRQYTLQAHVNQNSAVNLQLAVAGSTIALDQFGRTTAGGWGTPAPAGTFAFGPAWSVTGTAADYTTAAGFAFMSHGAVNVRHTALTGAVGANQAVYDSDQWVTVTIPVLATGQAIQDIIYARWVSITDNLACLISFNTDGTVTITAQKLVAGVTTTIGTNATLPGAYTAGDSFRMHMRVSGPDIWLKAWKVTTPVPEPAPWTTQGSDTAVKTPGQVGVSSIVTTGNTNTLPVVLSFSDYRAIGSVVDTSAGTTATSGAYVLLSQTFTATQPQHVIHLETRAAPGGANTILVDGIQLEPGAAANTFTTVGPTLRSPWTRGYVERWPAQWDPDSMGYLGIMSGPVVGPGFQLQSALLHAEYRSSVMAKSPRYYWPLNEPNGSTVFGEQSGYSGAPLNRFDATEGPATTFAPGTSIGIAGDPNGTGVNIDGNALIPPYNGSIIQTGQGLGNGLQLSGLGGTGLAWGVTVSFWASSHVPINTLSNSMFIMLTPNWQVDGGNMNILNTTTGANQGPSIHYGILIAGVNTSIPAGSANVGIDGLPHHYVGTIAFSNNVMVLNMYYDGALFGTATVASVSATFGSAALPSPFISASLMGIRTSSGSAFSVNTGIFGNYAHAAIFDRAVSAAEVTDLYAAGRGYPNENSGTRVARYVALAGFNGSADIGQGLTTMGVSTLAEGQDALSAVQAVQDTEFGNFYESQEGVAFRGRQARYLTTASSFTFGERVDLGEYPYLGNLMYDDDATYVYNNAIITRTGGSAAVATDPTGRSQIRYGQRTFTRTTGGNSDLEVVDLANYVVANSKDARPRLASLTFDPAATRGVTASVDGTLWPMLLKLEIGTRVTVKRRPKAANAGAGLTMSGDFFVEAITPNAVDEEAGTFLVTLLLSPAPVTSQPWILEDATWGQLDVTTVLGA